MTSNDFALFDAVQRDAYEPLFLENRATFLRKLKLFSQGNWLIQDGPKPVAYLVCHPWVLYDLVTLNAAELVLPVKADALYIHSVAVVHDYQRRGIGTLLYQKAREIAVSHGHTRMALVSVQRSHPFWRRVGRFRTMRLKQASLRMKLAAYGPDARYMVNRIAHTSQRAAMRSGQRINAGPDCQRRPRSTWCGTEVRHIA